LSINRDDLFRDKFRTSDGPLTGSVLYSLSLPDDLGYIAQVADALYAMCIEENWEKAGTVTVDEATQAAIEVLWSFRPMVGTIFPVLWDTIPDNYLLCDGASSIALAPARSSRHYCGPSEAAVARLFNCFRRVLVTEPGRKEAPAPRPPHRR